MLFLFYKSKEIRRLSFYLNSDTLFETVSHAAALKTIVEFKDWFRSNGYNAVIKEFQLLGEQAIVFSITENLIAQYGISELSNEVINIYIDVLHLGGRL